MAEWEISLNNKTLRRISLAEGQDLTIGRSAEADIMIDNTAISRRHLRLAMNGGLYLVTDLGSTNGTLVNGSRINGTVAVTENDRISFAKFTLCLTDKNDEDSFSFSSAMPMDSDEKTIFATAKPAKASSQAVHRPPPPRTLSVVAGNASRERLSLAGRSSIKIGSDSSSDLVITGFLIARAQCYIINREGKYWLVPQSSFWSTRINNRKIRQEIELRQGDIIKIRRTVIRFD